MATTGIRRAAASLLAATLISGALIAPASARSALQNAQHRRARLSHAISRVREDMHGQAVRLHREIAAATRQLASAPSAEKSLLQRWAQARDAILRERREASRELRKIDHTLGKRLASLQGRHQLVSAWIARYGVFQMCPVRGPHTVANNFGIIVRRPHVPVHVHQGNDITAAYGTPIVAPFNGTAVTAANDIGGLAVKVYGAGGYVYNAHLSSYGKLGAVKAGDVIGYVGATGDAGGPHDHFEWHPGGGAAVDPYVYLAAVC